MVEATKLGEEARILVFTKILKRVIGEMSLNIHNICKDTGMYVLLHKYVFQLFLPICIYVYVYHIVRLKNQLRGFMGCLYQQDS